MSNLFQRIIWNKYDTLGFKYDSNTSETFLPALSPTNDKQDIAENSSKNLIQHTNEEDLLENVQLEYIAENSSKNMIQPTNEEYFMENVEQEYIAQSPSISLIRNNNDIDDLEVMLQECINCIIYY
ncbi:uncharacterized protein LOC126895598 [Daktulosphaira vitifoliae]|uniref:uncharacterized protein LOC126895598 n=1 Tax=Daktulosphaira vitifoliae TaxID=58002 RepID=UPI0021A9B502|nr:uncharacterized protein LOC126895598 [Daktulosphaira vitifoliae]